MNKYLFITLVLILFFFPTPAYAHTLANDGTIQGILHIPPDDHPAANQNTRMKFQFNDKKNQFAITSCNCIFEVYQQKKKLYTIALQDEEISYTFPEKDVYKIIITGKPTDPSTFQPFTLTYDIRVEKDANDVTKEKKQAHEQFSLFLLAAGVISSIIVPLVISLA